MSFWFVAGVVAAVWLTICLVSTMYGNITATLLRIELALCRVEQKLKDQSNA